MDTITIPARDIRVGDTVRYGDKPDVLDATVTAIEHTGRITQVAVREHGPCGSGRRNWNSDWRIRVERPA